MEAGVRLSKEDWKSIRDAYCASGLSVPKFHREKLHLFCPGGRKPCLRVTYRWLKGLSPFRYQASEQGQVDIVSLDSTATAPQAGTCSCKCSTDFGEPSHGTVRLVLPHGVWVEIDTSSPEAFMLAVIGRLGDVR